jgi:hypothetical protein
MTGNIFLFPSRCSIAPNTSELWSDYGSVDPVAGGKALDAFAGAH